MIREGESFSAWRDLLFKCVGRLALIRFANDASKQQVPRLRIVRFANDHSARDDNDLSLFYLPATIASINPGIV